MIADRSGTIVTELPNIALQNKKNWDVYNCDEEMGKLSMSAICINHILPNSRSALLYLVGNFYAFSQHDTILSCTRYTGMSRHFSSMTFWHFSAADLQLRFDRVQIVPLRSCS